MAQPWEQVERRKGEISGAGHNRQGLVGHGEELKIVFSADRKPLKSLNKGSEFISLATLWQMDWKMCQKWKDSDWLIDHGTKHFKGVRAA